MPTTFRGPIGVWMAAEGPAADEYVGPKDVDAPGVSEDSKDGGASFLSSLGVVSDVTESHRFMAKAAPATFHRPPPRLWKRLNSQMKG